ncbi:MAG: tetratricopeptide repeat protein [Gammaproteobacteria bacterium]|nr:MAG: tetratricopeptide repeat protein [Gammaproteobacteria bacterium]
MPRDQNINQLMQDGLALFNAGRLDEAEACYQNVLKRQPRNVDALHLLALIYLNTKRFEEAERHLKKVTKLAPAFADAHSNLGILLAKTGKLEEAVQSFEKAARLDPMSLEAQVNLGNAYRELEQYDEAMRCFTTALEIEPDSPELHVNLGACEAAIKNYDKASEHYKKAISINPGYTKAYINLGNALQRERKLEDSVNTYLKAIALNPDNTEAHISISKSLCLLLDFDAALQHANRALELEPDSADAHVALAAILTETQRLDEAEDHCKKGIALEPESCFGYYVLSQVFDNKGRFDDAIIAAEKYWSLDKDRDADATFLAGLHLRMLEFTRGWELYLTHTHQGSPELSYIPTHVPRYMKRLPDKLDNKHILLVGEQGIGDQLFFLRFAPQLKERGAQLSLLCNPKITPILKLCAVFDSVFSFNDEPTHPRPPGFAIMSGDLPYVTGMADVAQIPGSLHLTPLSDHVTELKLQLRLLGKPPYIGITWGAGTPPQLATTMSYVPLYKEVTYKHIAREIGHLKATFLSLQRSPAPGEVDKLAKTLGKPVHDMDALNDDLARMLALLDLLDDYYAVSNTNIHLRSCLGKASHVWIPHPPEWRWTIGPGRSPWFPDCPVSRQKPDGIWLDFV